MRFKYYLRGAGVGVIVTTIIFTIIILLTGFGRMTDQEAVERAKELGYVLPSTTAVASKDNTIIIPPSESTDSVNKANSGTASGDDSNTTKPTDADSNANNASAGSDTPTDTSGSSSAGGSQLTENSNDVITSVANPGVNSTGGSVTSVTYIPFTINQGEDSESIVKRLCDLGLVADYSKFNRMLADKGVDDKIAIGTFYVNSSMSEDELCEILGNTKKRKTSLSD